MYKPRVICPTTLNADEQAATINMTKKHLSEPELVINLVIELTSKTISHDNLRHFAKKACIQ